MDYKGTKTEANLWAAFAGESQARNKYTYFASVAKKEGYEQIAAIFSNQIVIYPGHDGSCTMKFVRVNNMEFLALRDGHDR